MIMLRPILSSIHQKRITFIGSLILIWFADMADAITFARLPWIEDKQRQALSEQFQVYALPTLQILHSDGTNLTSWGKAAVTRNREKCLQDWKNKSSGASFLQLLGWV
jgi:hypothetical protein